MVDWEAATSVALSGVLCVFGVLAVLMITVQVSGRIISSQAQKKQQKQKA